MKLPWNNKEELEDLETKIKSLEEEKEKLQKRFDAEQERRKKLSRQKQEAEKELNKLKDKLRSLKQVNEEEEVEEGSEFKQLGFDKTLRTVTKLGSMKSEEKDMVTVYSPSKIQELEDLKSLKNSVNREQYNKIEEEKSFIAFLDKDTVNTVIKTVPFFRQDLNTGSKFRTSRLNQFIQEEKYWALVSAGETHIYKERNGEVEEVETIKSRVDRKHSSGGFSQGRFERKREEQIDKHVEQVENEINSLDPVYLLGEKELCQELPGSYLGGFDPNRKRPEQFYQFQKLSF